MIDKLNWVQDSVLETAIQEVFIDPEGQVISVCEIEDSLEYLRNSGLLDENDRPTELALDYRARNSFHIGRGLVDITGEHRREIQKTYDDLHQELDYLQDEIYNLKRQISDLEDEHEFLLEY